MATIAFYLNYRDDKVRYGATILNDARRLDAQSPYY